MTYMDLNADAGESFGSWPMGNDEALFPLISSANLACGFHAGDPLVIQRSVELAVQHDVGIGAHVGYPDLVGFGRRDLAMSDDELFAAVVYQIGALAAFTKLAGTHIQHVKAHGALYLQMMDDERVASTVARAVRAYDPGLLIFVLAGPGGQVMRDAAAAAGLTVKNEAFPDRNYLPDGRLSPRSHPDSLVLDPVVVQQRAVQIAQAGTLTALDGSQIALAADTLCLHGDNAEAVDLAAAVSAGLKGAGVHIGFPT